MLDSLLDKLAVVDSLLWGPWTMAFLAGVAVFFTVRSGFFKQWPAYLNSLRLT